MEFFQRKTGEIKGKKEIENLLLGEGFALHEMRNMFIDLAMGGRIQAHLRRRSIQISEIR